VRRIPIHIKLMAALAVPLIALLVLAALEFVSNSREAREVRREADLALAATGPGGLISTLQEERNISGVFILGAQDIIDTPVGNPEEARANTDDALDTFLDRIERSDRAEEVYAPAVEALENDLDDLRGLVDEQEWPDELTIDPERREVQLDIFAGYSTVITAMLDGNTALAQEIDDPDMRRGAELIDLTSRQTDLLAHLVSKGLSTVAGSGGQLEDREIIADMGALYGELLANGQGIAIRGTGQYGDAYELRNEQNQELDFVGVFGEIFETREVDQAAMLASVSATGDEGYFGFRGDVEEVLAQDARSAADDATRRVQVFQALALVVIFTAMVVVFVVARSITRPLRSLTEQAGSMANERLPNAVQDILETPLGEDVTVPHIDPITVKTRDEVADVADALNTVQDSALELAVEQAVLRRNIADSFVNLGRRNQNLLGRQLDFITELEQNETDPDTLANLFRLDHLATRMRRNAESLLVLAGIDPPRKWAAPVRLTDVIRAALGEVEDYQRVTVRAVEPATIIGTAAADLAHLLAELVENALTFSPPDQTVEIRGRNQPGGYTLAIVDSGLGMPPEEITRANRRLAGAESFTIAPSKYLGHYVAGNLAARHNITIQLQDATTQGNGTVGTVHLPTRLLTTDEAAAAGPGARGTDTGDRIFSATPSVPPGAAGPLTPPGGTTAATTAAGLPRRNAAPPNRPLRFRL
jgi:signal transduction histidine kinase